MARSLPGEATVARRLNSLTRNDLSGAAIHLAENRDLLLGAATFFASRIGHDLANALAIDLASYPTLGLANHLEWDGDRRAELTLALSLSSNSDLALARDIALAHHLDVDLELANDLAADLRSTPDRNLERRLARDIVRARSIDIDLGRDLGRFLGRSRVVGREVLWGAVRIRAWWYQILIAWAVTDPGDPVDLARSRPAEPERAGALPRNLAEPQVSLDAAEPSKADADELADAAEAVLGRAQLEYDQRQLWKHTLDEPNIESWIRTLRDELYRPGGDDGNRDYWTINRFSLRLQQAIVQRRAEVEKEDEAKRLLEELRERVLDPLSEHEPESDETQSAESVAAFFAEHLDPEALLLRDDERERWAAFTPEQEEFERRGRVYELLGWSSGNTYGSTAAVGGGIGAGASALAGIVATSLTNAAALTAVGTGIGGLVAIVITFAAKRLQTGWQLRNNDGD